MNVVLPTRMSVEEFLAWAARQDKGRYELLEGRVVMQQSQNWAHAETTLRVVNALAATIERAGVPYFAGPVGMTVRVAERIAFEPDALVAPLPKPRATDLEVPNPVIVVEVLSPSTTRRDLTDKLFGYFRVPSVAHYLVLDPEEREAIWYARSVGGAMAAPRAQREGVLRLDPPGIELGLADIFPPE